MKWSGRISKHKPVSTSCTRRKENSRKSKKRMVAKPLPKVRPVGTNGIEKRLETLGPSEGKRGTSASCEKELGARGKQEKGRTARYVVETGSSHSKNQKKKKSETD